MVVLLVAELIFGWRSLSTLIQRQTAHFFRLCQVETNKDVATAGDSASNPLLAGLN
jgi:hypothetical protein